MKARRFSGSLITLAAALALTAGLLASPAAGQTGDDTIHGSLDRGDEQMGKGEYVDHYTIEARRGQRIELDLRSDDFDTFLILVGPDDQRWENDDEGGTDRSYLDIEAPDSGEYEIMVTSYSAEETGDYELEVNVGGRGSGPGRPRDRDGRREQGELTRRDEQMPTGEYFDTYTLDARRGEVFEISLESIDFDTFLVVRGPDGEQETDDDGGGGTDSRLVYEAPRDGEYEVIVTSYSEDETGEYTLRIEPFGAGDRGGVRTETGELEYGDATLADGEYFDEYRFEGRRGQQVDLELTSDEFDAYILLIAPSDDQQEDDDGGDGTNSRLNTVLDENGQYRVLVTSYAADETGEYRLVMDLGTGETVDADTERERGSLDDDDPQLKRGEYYDTYHIDGQAGQRVRVELTSDDFDTYLVVVTPEGDRLTNDDGGSGTDSELEFVMDESGEYEIIATSYGAAATGDYELAITTYARDGRGDRRGRGRERVIEEEGELEDDDERLSSGEYYDEYRFEARRGDRLIIEVESDDFDTYLLVEDPDGDTQRDDDGGDRTNSRLEMIAPATGEYEVRVSSYAEGEEGDYELRITVNEGVGDRDDRDHRRDRDGTIRETGRLSRGDSTLDTGEYYDVVEFRGRRGDRVRIRLQSDDFDTYLILQSPSGDQEENDDGGPGTNSEMELRLDETGEYEVYVTSYSEDETGEYELTIELLD